MVLLKVLSAEGSIAVDENQGAYKAIFNTT
jgi:hypothetical protein